MPNHGRVLSCPGSGRVAAAAASVLADEWLEVSGRLTEPFRLQKHLLLPVAPKAAAAATHSSSHHNGVVPIKRD